MCVSHHCSDRGNRGAIGTFGTRQLTGRRIAIECFVLSILFFFNGLQVNVQR